MVTKRAWQNDHVHAAAHERGIDMQLPDTLTSTPVLVAIGAVVLAVIGAVVITWIYKRRTSSQPQQESAPIPDYELHPLRGEVANQLHARWQTLQQDFVDAPADTLRRADALVAEAMRERGYPAVDADGRGQLLRDHEPAHASRYDQLRRAVEHDGESSTEERRQALLQARTLFDALLRDDASGNQERMFAA